MERTIDLAALTTEELLKLRFKDLPLSIRGCWLEECVDALHAELAAKGIPFRPECYLADEWLSPDTEPVVGIPFYLAHPRLMELEKKMLHTVEGGDRASCMKLLRHEAGHAINYAYELHKDKQWRRLFGRFSAEYPDRYKYRPYSKSFVLHLDEWYAQYHPDEDFAETFAVWLAPDSGWQEKYKGWKALEKLRYVDALMQGIAARPLRKPTGRKHWRIAALTATLATHYKRRTEFYAEYSPDFHDAQLRAIFPAPAEPTKRPAARLLAQYRRHILNATARWAGERKFIVEHLLKDLTRRARELKLSAHPDNDALPLMLVTAYITTLVMNYVYTGRFKRKKR